MIYCINLGVEPIIAISIEVHSKSEKTALDLVRKLFNIDDKYLTSDYSKNRYADCFSISISDETEEEIINELKGECPDWVGIYISESKEIFSNDLDYFILVWGFNERCL